MTARIRGPEGALRLGDGPVLFSGTPPVLRGEVAVVNTSVHDLKVRGIATAAPAAPARAAKATAHAAATAPAIIGEVRMTAKLAPGAAARVPARLRVDPFTAAGRYATVLEVDGRQVEAVVQVFERDSVRIEPRPVFVRGVAGETLTQPMILTNLGNVSHTVPAGGLVHLGEKDWLGRSLVYALRETDIDHDHNHYLDQLFREVRSTLPAPARFTTKAAGDGALPPGATVEVELQLTIPEALVKGRTYVGRTTFLGAGLGFKVDCIGTAKTVKRRAR